MGVCLGRPHPENRVLQSSTCTVNEKLTAPRLLDWKVRCPFCKPAQEATKSAYLQNKTGSGSRVQHRGLPTGETLTALHKLYLPHHAGTRKSGWFHYKRELQMMVRAVPCSRAIKTSNNCQLKPPCYIRHATFSTEFWSCVEAHLCCCCCCCRHRWMDADRATGNFRAPSTGDNE